MHSFVTFSRTFSCAENFPQTNKKTKQNKTKQQMNKKKKQTNKMLQSYFECMTFYYLLHYAAMAQSLHEMPTVFKIFLAHYKLTLVYQEQYTL
jgi:hypothetical protein